MALTVLLDALPECRVVGTAPRLISALTDDSRGVGPGACFVAVPGLRHDGLSFVPDALRQGAALLVAERETPEAAAAGVAQVVVPEARDALGRLADAWHGCPSSRLTVVGITGTNGKTTTSWLVAAVLAAAGRPSGIVGTIQHALGEERVPATQTTPDALTLHELLARMERRGLRGVAMEVSSHALELRRADTVAFDVAVFTNLTQDHLDFHGSLGAYRTAKRRLFELLARSPKSPRTAVVNVDDPAGASMVAGLGLEVLGFGFGSDADVRAVRYTSALDGIRLEAATPAGPLELSSRLIGEHNVLNLLGAAAVGLALGLDAPRIATALATVDAVPGRFEEVRAGQPFLVIVDYAHTPDALERVLDTARRLTPGRLGVVFGCGGDRDRGKRPIMGRIAAEGADAVWITSDNPRSEPPAAITAAIEEGARGVAGASGAPAVIADRAEAIGAAMAWARPGDTVVIAGKGHEATQTIGSRVLPFDDRAQARVALALAGWTDRQLGDLAGRQLGDLAGRQLGDLAGPA